MRARIGVLFDIAVPDWDTAEQLIDELVRHGAGIRCEFSDDGYDPEVGIETVAYAADPEAKVDHERWTRATYGDAAWEELEAAERQTNGGVA